MLPKSLHKLPVMAALILPLFNQLPGGRMHALLDSRLVCFSFEGGLLLPQNATTPSYIIEFFLLLAHVHPKNALRDP